MYHHYRHDHVPDEDKFYVVSVVSNPQRYQSRYRLFQEFRERCHAAGAQLVTVELAFGDRSADMGADYTIRTSHEIWHKENLINYVVSRLPWDWKYVAWIDADVEFVREDWVHETIHELQHHSVIQMFETAIDLGPNGETLQINDGFVRSWIGGEPPAYSRGYHPHWHPGYAWAMRRDAWDHLGGLFDVAILGAADHHMAWAFIGRVLQNSPKFLSPGYVRALETWQDRCNAHIRQNIGAMRGTLLHHWHGKKKDRKYRDRWEILKKWDFDPDQDLKRDFQGIYQLSDKGLRMRNDLRAYFRARNEDSIDLK